MATDNKRLLIRPIPPKCKGGCRLHLELDFRTPAGKEKEQTIMGRRKNLGKMPTATPADLEAIGKELMRQHGTDLETAILQQMWQLFRVASQATIKANPPGQTSTSELLYKFVTVLMSSAMMNGSSAEAAASAVNAAVKLVGTSPRAQAEQVAASTLQA